ncbi:lysophospholipid acyltransferase 2-like [Ylistrum balloti]|uniref:lysophospholipid acyltransferase 2-like n=1 Tax=Ylistrum balloti TaxID=509963 RepID=UPI0029059437|nr:lysophospholipid acyltransferase 2-like [Ylistrum balloti]
MVHVGQFYQGSGLLQPVSNITGLPLDQVNYLTCNIIAFFCAIQLRKRLPGSLENSTQRHIVELCLGLALSFFCFGYQIIHMILYSAIPYLLMLYGPRASFHKMVFAVAMGYTSVMHLYRLYYDFFGFSLDVTGPLMLMTQKCTSVAFALHDGTEKEEEKLSEDQKKMCIKKTPDALSYFSYIFCFHGLMAGPLCFYADYIHFINGENYKVAESKAVNNHETERPTPNPESAMKETGLIVAVCGILMLLSPIFFPVSRMTEDEFLYDTNILYRNLYLLICVSLVRAKYYFAWKLGELTNQSAGLGFNGYDENGKEKWDLLNNLHIWKLETATSLKVNIDTWNIQTLIWLRRVVYDRTPKAYNTVCVFVVSAWWHGFYPGYYLTFVTTAFVILATRQVRRNIRPYFQKTEQMKFFYDCITFAATRMANVYLASSFCLLSLSASLRLLISVGFYIHIFTAVTLVYFTFISPPKKREDIKKSE